MNAIEWVPPHTRGAGLIADLLRDRWRHATLWALEHGPLQPGALIGHFRTDAAEPRNIAAFGSPAVYREYVHRHLAELFHGGLVARRTTSANPEFSYELTAVAAGVLEAIGAAADFGLAVFPELVVLSQDLRHLPHVSVEPPGPPQQGPGESGRDRRLAALLVFAVLLQPPWTLSVLTGLSGGPLRPSALTARVNAVVAASADVLTTRSVSAATVYARLARLHGLGYTRLVDDPAGRNPRRPPGAPEHASALTERGEALLDSLLPAAAFGAAHDGELAMMARAAMRGRAAARLPGTRKRPRPLPEAEDGAAGGGSGQQ